MATHPFDLELLITPSLLIFIITVGVSYRITRSAGLSLTAALIKVGIFLIYFALFFDGTYTFKDDWKYLQGGSWLLSQGVGLTNIAENWDKIIMSFGGLQFGYYFYNTYAFALFGEGYYAPVALNIILTVFIAWLGARIAASEFGTVGVLETFIFFFILFHPDILAWSNILNAKDILILFLNVLMIYSASLFFKGRYVKALALIAATSSMLFFLRFYVPFLFTMALAVSLLFMSKHRMRWVVVFMMVMIVISMLGESRFHYALARLSQNFANPLYGLPRFLLTPIPLHTEAAYSFLNIPALINWISMPFALWGAVLIIREKTPFAFFFLIYFLLFIGLYACFDTLQGPRHRVQLDFSIAIFQAAGFMGFLRMAFMQHTLVFRSLIFDREATIS